MLLSPVGTIERKAHINSVVPMGLKLNFTINPQPYMAGLLSNVPAGTSFIDSKYISTSLWAANAEKRPASETLLPNLIAKQDSQYADEPIIGRV